MKLFLLGMLVGLVVVYIIGVIRYKFGGLLRVHYEEETDRPYLFLELNDVPDKIVRKRYVIFKVKIDSRQ